MGARTIKKISFFIKGFTNAFAPIEDDLLKSGGYYMKTISNKRREKLISYEKNRNEQEGSRSNEAVSA